MDTKIVSESPGTRFFMISVPFWGSPGGPFSSKIRSCLKKNVQKSCVLTVFLECLPKLAIFASRAQFLPVLASENENGPKSTFFLKRSKKDGYAKIVLAL